MQIARIHDTAPQDADPLLREYIDAKKALDLAQNRLKKAQAVLLDQMAHDHQKSYRWTKEGRTYGVTYVRAERVEVDEKALRKALTAKVFDKYTVRKLDRKAMEAAIDTGDIDPMVVAKHVLTKPGEPYLRYSEKEIEDE